MNKINIEIEKQLKQIEEMHLKITKIHPESVSESFLKLQRIFLNQELDKQLLIHGVANKKVKI